MSGLPQSGGKEYSPTQNGDVEMDDSALEELLAKVAPSKRQRAMDRLNQLGVQEQEVAAAAAAAAQPGVAARLGSLDQQQQQQSQRGRHAAESIEERKAQLGNRSRTP